MSQVPDGARKLPYLKVPTSKDVWNDAKLQQINELSDIEIAEMGFLTRAELQSLAQANPGSHWYIFGEPNRQPHMTGTRFAAVFRYFATVLKGADPSAKILSPSVLNWDFQCIGCLGYTFGFVWAKEFIDAYQAKYGENPPADVWAIDVYPIDWVNMPNNDPNNLALYIPGGGLTQHSSIAVQQLVAMRQYLDSEGYESAPIWITEIALHVGYDPSDWLNKSTGDPCTIFQVLQNQCDLPSTDLYHWDKVSNYIIEILDWMDVNAATYSVEKWFFYKTWRDIVNVGGDGYMGITFLDDPAKGTAPNCLGETYRTRSLGLPPKKCDADGNTVSAP